MKKLRTLLCCIATLLLAWSCDKIESDNYLIYSGAVGTWYDGQGVADHSQRAFLEKYTGPKCVNCPTADNAIHAAMEAYGDKLVVVAIHDSSSFSKPIGNSPDMRTDDGDAWSTALGVRAAGSYPCGIVCREQSAPGVFGLFTPTSGIEAKVDPILAQAPVVALDVKSQLNGTTTNITVNIEYLQECTEPLTLTLFLMEDGIIAAQKQPDGSTDENYVHNHVLRDVITDLWGASIDANGAAGCKRYATFQYAIPSTDWNLDNCHIVAFVSKANKAILNVAECEL